MGEMDWLADLMNLFCNMDRLGWMEGRVAGVLTH